jgi:serine/threonine protein kinase
MLGASPADPDEPVNEETSKF